jgi:hypothetical protein
MTEKILFDRVNSFLAEWDPIGMPENLRHDEYAGYVPGFINASDSVQSLKLKIFEFNEAIEIQIDEVDIDELANDLYKIIHNGKNI